MQGRLSVDEKWGFRKIRGTILGFRVWGLGFRVYVLGFRVSGLGFGVWGGTGAI